MKNQVKRWTAFALVMAMIFSVLTPVFAEDRINVTLTGPAALSGRPVSAYKLIDGEDSSAVLTALAKVFFDESMLAKYGFADQSEVISGLGNENFTASQLKQLGADIKAFVTNSANVQTAVPSKTETFSIDTATGQGVATLDLTSDGVGCYAFVVPDKVGDDGEEYQEVETILTQINSDVTIAMKSDQPPVDKTVKDEDGEYVDSKETVVGQIHEFKLETYVPYVKEEKLGLEADQKATYSFAFVDELTLGLAMYDVGNKKQITLDELTADMITLRLAGKPLTNDEKTVYTVTKVDDKTFRVDIVDLSIFSNKNMGQTLAITYNTIVTNKAAVPAGIVATNEAYVEYEHNGGITTSYTDTVNLLDLTITIDKWSTTDLGGTAEDLREGSEETGTPVATDRGNNEYSLAGAEFELYRLNDDEDKEYYTYDATTKKGGWTMDETRAMTFVTRENGQVKILGLTLPDLEATDTYYLLETKAPNGGYERYVTPITLKITNTGLDNDNRTPKLEMTVDNQLSTAWMVSVQNEPEGWLPSTGSIGTYLFIAVGVALIIGATLLKKRPNSAK